MEKFEPSPKKEEENETQRKGKSLGRVIDEIKLKSALEKFEKHEK